MQTPRPNSISDGQSEVKPEQSSHLVSGTGLGVQMGSQWLVRDVDISIAPGEIVTLIGPNGAGKSTVAKLIIGALKPTDGTLERRPDLRIGYVPQKLNIDWTFPLSVKRLLSLTKAHDDNQIVEALKKTDAAHLINAPVQQLSGGEYQRVLMARALISRPNLLVLDEPVQGVDYMGQAALYDLIGHLRDESGCGVLMISHDLHVVMAQTDKVICLNGHVCCSGTPEIVANSPQFLELFGQNSHRTHAFYQHHHDHSHGADGRVVAHDPSESASDV